MSKDLRAALLIVGLTGLLLLLAAVVPIPVKADPVVGRPVPSVDALDALGPHRVVADDIVRPSIPCAVLVKYAALKGKVPVTEGLGELYAASLRLHAVMEKSNKLSKHMFLEATADVLNCVDFKE